MPISFTQAALGAKVEIPTISGKADLTIPGGTQTGQLFRLRGLGLPDLRSGRTGDAIVQVTVEIPKKLNNEQSRVLHRKRVSRTRFEMKQNYWPHESGQQRPRRKPDWHKGKRHRKPLPNARFSKTILSQHT